MLSQEVTTFQGIGQFGPAYRRMLEGDSHAPGSVDRVLLETMIRLCPQTAEYLYERHTPTSVAPTAGGSRPKLQQIVALWLAEEAEPETIVEHVAEFCSRLGAGVDNNDLDAITVGGTEEEIIARGFDWCTDVARVGCILCQVAGVPARLVLLANTDQAYSGHVIVEACRMGVWGAVDTSTDVVYRLADGRPATTWELMNEPDLIDACGKGKCYSSAGQFRAACIANYVAADHAKYDYTTRGVNAYYRLILEHSAAGWPNGLRWLHGEESPLIS
jgi:hypothetical protein